MVEYPMVIAQWQVYVHINKINGKRYVGLTNKKKATSRWETNGRGYKGTRHFYSAIQKYGWDSFDHIILADHLTKSEASNLEIMLIKAWDTRNPEYGYNYQIGGYTGNLGMHMSEKTKEKIRRGNSVHAKKVVCLNTRVIYDCETDAANAYDINSAYSISGVAEGKHQFAGWDTDGNPLRWVYYNDYIQMTEEGIKQQLSVPIKKTNEEDMVCLNSLQVFHGIAEASRYCGSNPSGIIRCAQSWMGKQSGHIRKHAGTDPKTKEHLSWMYKRDFDILSDERRKQILRFVNNPTYGYMGSKSVYCLTTMQLFSSVREGAKFAQQHISANISTSCTKNKIGKSGKHPITGEWLYWMYQSDYDKLSSQEKTEIIEKYTKEEFL